MAASLTSKRISENDFSSIPSSLGGKSVRSMSSGPQEPFAIRPAEDESQKEQKNQNKDSTQTMTAMDNDAQKTGEIRDEKSVDKAGSDGTTSKSSQPISSAAILASFFPLDSKIEYNISPKTLEPDDDVTRANFRLKGQDQSVLGQQNDSALEESSNISSEANNFQIGDPVTKRSDPFGLVGGIGKTGISPTSLDLESEPASILSAKESINLPAKEGVEGQIGQEKQDPGSDDSGSNLSGQSGANGTFSPISLDKKPETGSDSSFSLTSQVSEGLNESFGSNQELSPEQEQIIQQLTGYLKNNTGDVPQSIRLTLSPETLGTIQIDISVKNQQVKADLVASTEQVKGLLESHQVQLRNNLSENGLRIEQFTVRLDESSSSQTGGLLNFHNQYFQSQSEAKDNFQSLKTPVISDSNFSASDDAVHRVSGNSLGGISIYI